MWIGGVSAWAGVLGTIGEMAVGCQRGAMGCDSGGVSGEWAGSAVAGGRQQLAPAMLLPVRT